MAIFTKAICRANTIPIKIPVGLFAEEIDRLILKLIWKFKGLRIAKTILKKMNNIGRLTALVHLGCFDIIP